MNRQEKIEKELEFVDYLLDKWGGIKWVSTKR